MATQHYNIAAEDADAGGINWLTGDYRILLLTGVTTTPDNKDHRFVADVVADEASDPSYSRQTLGGKTAVTDDPNNRRELAMLDVDFGALDNETPTQAVIFLQVTNDADSRLHSIHDLTPVATDGTGYVLVVGTEGAIHIRST